MKILVIDDEPSFRDYLALILTDVFKHQVTVAGSCNEAMHIPQEQLVQFDIAFIDMQMPMLDGFQTGLRLKHRAANIVTIMLTAYPSVKKVILALRDHEFDDFLVKEELQEVEENTALKNTLLRGENLAAARKALSEEYQLSDALRSRYSDVYSEIVGESEEIHRLKLLLEKVAPSNTTVLISGETGTGKELIAREIHRLSRRRLKPFVPINCSAIPSALLESELFGHKKGAFTGAVGNREGFFRLAEGGTLFLDEIGDMPHELQSKLLRVLEDRKFFPVGSGRLSDAVNVDVRIISASHQDLQKKTEVGEFRQDLLYRLNTMVLIVPPLRNRIDDIGLLAEYFLTQSTSTDTILGIRPDAMEVLKRWTWPGNVRELSNVIERSVLLCDSENLGIEHFPAEIQAVAKDRKGSEGSNGAIEPCVLRPAKEPPPLNSSVKSFEKVWEQFKANGFKLWTFANGAAVEDTLKTGLQGARYIKKGHSARLVVVEDFVLDVVLIHVNAATLDLDECHIRFLFHSDYSPHQSRRSEPGQKEGGRPIIQPVVKGQPDTYLFNLLYPPARRSSLESVSYQRLIRAVLLRFAMNHTYSRTLKSVFEQTMTFMMDEEMSSLVEGLNSSGLEAMRAYLCGADHIFTGMARKLKSNQEAIRQEILAFFPDYQ